MCGKVQFARNSWLADIELDPERLDLPLINIFFVQYQWLDLEFYKFKPASYGKKNFLLMSRKLDERVKQCK